MKKYNIPIECVIMHHTVTGKLCPAMWTHNESELKGYYDFLKSIDNTVESTIIPPTTSTSSTTLPYKVKVIDNYLNVRKNAGLNYPVICTIKKNEVYTIISEKQVKNKDGSIATWGLLKAYQTGQNGWINVGEKYIQKV